MKFKEMSWEELEKDFREKLNRYTSRELADSLEKYKTGEKIMKVKLKVREDINLKILENYGFKKEIYKRPTHKYECGGGDEDYYTEIVWVYDNWINICEVLEKRENSDWIHPNEERDLYIYPSDYDMGVSDEMLVKIYDLIKDGLIVKEEHNGR